MSQLTDQNSDKTVKPVQAHSSKGPDSEDFSAKQNKTDSIRTDKTQKRPIIKFRDEGPSTLELESEGRDSQKSVSIDEDYDKKYIQNKGPRNHRKTITVLQTGRVSDFYRNADNRPIT